MSDVGRPPLHVGIIMDGNGRWAQSRGLARISGHARGAKRVTEIVRGCPDIGVTHLTLYAFSTENWRRPVAEVEGLMKIFQQYILSKLDGLQREGVRVRFIGMRHRIPLKLQRLMARLEEATAECERLNLTIAIDYGGRDEIARAVQKMTAELGDGPVEEIGEDSMAAALDTAGLPDPDFIIRTSGEQRVSNFLLWQGVYAEYSFPEIPWPEFTLAHLRDEVTAFRSRDRRFGAVGAPTSVSITAGG
ncbi:polyprenyl diphosphate synthase [Amaricoccus macauensis]|uniref:polyprenyl diphosphate synthase n=1 Tax=Amaricoccus macauensis TaxID=57001 RepID=UPI003C7C3AA3